MLRCLYDPDEKYLGEMSNYIIRTYGDILRKKLDMFPDFPTWKQIDKIMDVLEGVKFERELLEGVKFERELAEQNRTIHSEHSQESPIKEQLPLIREDDEQSAGQVQNKQNDNVA